MKTEVVQFVFAALVLVFGGAAEELLPKVLGVGFPVLLSATLLVSARASAPAALLFALAAGALEDALCGLPAATGIGFFTLAALAFVFCWSGGGALAPEEFHFSVPVLMAVMYVCFR